MANHSMICLKNPMNSTKRQKDMTVEDEHPPPTQVSRCSICYCGRAESPADGGGSLSEGLRRAAVVRD